MKKKLHYFCLFLIAISQGMRANALEPIEGVYHITSAQDLADFAQIVNNTDPEANALLTTDIDLSSQTEFSIGTQTPYAGCFDGGHHRITILRTAEGQNNALFHTLAGTVKNLTVDGQIFCNDKYAAGIASKTSGEETKIINCVSNVTIQSTWIGDGTHGGIVALVEGHLEMENSAFTGAFVSEVTGSWGGLCGWTTGTANYKSCMMIADVSGALSESSNTFARNPGNCSFSNCVYLNPLGNIPGGSIQITTEQLASGEACFILNGKQSTDCAWFQNLPDDPIPAPDNTRGTVFANGHLHCNGEAYEGDILYSNTNLGTTVDEHDWNNGICNFCHNTDPNYMTASKDGFYEIETPEQFLWFAALANTAKLPEYKGRLTANIDLNNIQWPGIGNSATPFCGTFEGGGHKIENLNAPLFGTTRNAALTGIAIESATINGRNTTLGNQTGSIVCVANQTTLTRSYSKANITLGDEGDLGGLVGKLTGTISNCAFLGTLSSAGWSEGGIAGSGEAGAITIENCLVYATLLTTGGDAKGTILGWNDAAHIENCFTINTPEGFNGFSGNTSGGEIDCHMLSTEAFAHGDVAWKLNKSSFVHPAWFQTIGEDLHPITDPTHSVVYQVAQEEYSNDMELMKETLTNGANEYVQNVNAQEILKNEFIATINPVSEATSYEELCTAFTLMEQAGISLQRSAKSYEDYINEVNRIKLYLEEHAAEIGGPSLLKLESYLYDNTPPETDVFPHGSFEYIIAQSSLNEEEMAQETLFVQSLLDEAVKNGYAPGAEITTLIKNANLDAVPNFDGWTFTKQGATFTVMRENDTTYTAEAWNATFELEQTITGLSDGIYEVRLNAAYRAANNEYDGNNNYAGLLCANENAVYVMTEGEDLIAPEDAINMENCYIKGNKNPDKLFDNGIQCGYYPSGPVGCTYAFKAGRYENRIVAYVKDGKLTITLKNAGTGCELDWMGFDNFRLFYLGGLEQASEAINPTLQGMIARANTVLAYEGDSGEEYNKRPNFDKALRTQLEETITLAKQANTTEEKMAAVNQFSRIFQEIILCKQAYVTLEATAESLMTQVYENPTATFEEQTDLQEHIAQMMQKWENGDYSTEEAYSKEDLLKSIYCQRYLKNAPASILGVWQLTTARELLWFSQIVNEMGDTQAQAILVAPIDMNGIDWLPIGKANHPFSGKFRGGLHPITNLNMPLFGTVNNANITGIAIQGGSIGGNTDYAAHTGSIIGHAQGHSFLTESYSTAHVQNAPGDCGGLIGKISGGGTMKNCFFAGNITSGWSAGCLLGSSDGTASIAEISHCYVDASAVTYKNGDAHGLVVGWLHDELTGNLNHIYVIAAPELTNLMGHTDNEAGAAQACITCTTEEFACGKVTHLLNEGEETSPIWFQTLGTDPCPVLDNSHLIVILNEDGTYSNQNDVAIEKVEIIQKLPEIVNVVDMQGRLIRSQVKAKQALKGLPAGIYIINGCKVMQQ